MISIPAPDRGGEAEKKETTTGREVEARQKQRTLLKCFTVAHILIKIRLHADS